MSHSEHCEEVYRVLLMLREADSGAEVPRSDVEAAEKEAQRLLAQEEAVMDGETLWDPQPRYSWEPLELGKLVNGVLIGEWGWLPELTLGRPDWNWLVATQQICHGS